MTTPTPLALAAGIKVSPIGRDTGTVDRFPLDDVELEHHDVESTLLDRPQDERGGSMERRSNRSDHSGPTGRLGNIAESPQACALFILAYVLDDMRHPKIDPVSFHHPQGFVQIGHTIGATTTARLGGDDQSVSEVRLQIRHRFLAVLV